MSSSPSRTRSVEAILSGALTTSAVAQQHGVGEAEVAQWVALYASGTAQVTSAQRRRSSRVMGLVVALVVSGVVFVGGAALSAGTCAQTLPAPLVTFCPNDPAIASEINGNFAGVLSIVNSRVAANVATAELASADGGVLQLQTTSGGATKVGGSLQVGSNAALVCNAANSGALRQGTGVFEVCMNGQWTTLSTLSTTGATISCATLLAASPSLPNGTYALSANGYAFQAQCDMAGGGWTMIQAHTTARTIESLRVFTDSATFLPAGAVRSLAAAATQVRLIDVPTGATATSNANGQAIGDLRNLDAININDQGLWTYSNAGILSASNFTNSCGSTSIYPTTLHTCGNSGGAHVGPDVHNLFSSGGAARLTLWVR